ncbi:MAG: DUF58 domain-containing protein [Planctomycetes bacterium]|nr:DUF58 domain-containing protein [Planctomycetota bacterium]
MRFPRFAKPFTREGFFWLMISAAMLVTALIKGINLITLLASWMLTIVFLNLFWASRQLRHLKAERFLGEPAFAGTPCQVHLRLQNTSKKQLGGLGVREDRGEHAQTAFLTQLGPGAAQTIAYNLVFPSRGRQTLKNVELNSGHPFGLVRLRRAVATEQEIVVFPRLGTLNRGLLRRFLGRYSPSIGQAQAFARRHPGAQTEFHGLRAFRAGDSPRWIHWRTTARRGELMVREFEDLPDEQLVVVMDALRPALAEDGSVDVAAERALSFAATICWEYCRHKGNRLALGIAGATPAVIEGTTGMPLALEMLEALALMQRDQPQTDEPLIDKLVEAELPTGPMLLVTLRDTDLATRTSRALGRPVAQINVARGEDTEFFDLTPAPMNGNHVAAHR